MLIVEYKPTNKVASIADGDIESFVNAVISDYLEAITIHSDYIMNITVSNELVITQFRVAICKENIKHTDICFKFNDDILLPTIDGRLPRWPEGFCDHNAKLLAILCRSNIKSGFSYKNPV
jgi:hypothetical protein